MSLGRCDVYLGLTGLINFGSQEIVSGLACSVQFVEFITSILIMFTLPTVLSDL